jgi:quinoprotein glucose dehydrogenase
MIAMNEKTLGRGAGISNLLFGVYAKLVTLLGETLAYRGGLWWLQADHPITP